VYQETSKRRIELQRLVMSSSTTKISLSLDALVKPVQVVGNLNSNKATVGAMLFVCGDAGDCLGYYALDEANATSERVPELKLMFERHRAQGLPVRACNYPGRPALAMVICTCWL
jgi:hypothetical protein